MSINFHIASPRFGIMKAVGDELSKLIGTSISNTSDKEYTIKLSAQRVRGSRPYLTAYGPVSAFKYTNSVAFEASKAIGAEYSVYSSPGTDQILLDFKLTNENTEALSKNPGLLSESIFRGLISTNADTSGEFESYLSDNPSKGYLQIQVYSGRSIIPISAAKVTVSKTLSDKYILSTVYTDENGRTPVISLPAKPAAMSQTPKNSTPYTSYDIMVEKEEYLSVENKNVPIFEGILSIQPVKMNADTGGNAEVFDEKL